MFSQLFSRSTAFRRNSFGYRPTRFFATCSFLSLHSVPFPSVSLLGFSPIARRASPNRSSSRAMGTIREKISFRRDQELSDHVPIHQANRRLSQRRDSPQATVPQIVPPTGHYCASPLATTVSDPRGISLGKYKQ